MPVHETISAGKPCWVDLVSSDLESVKPFYEQVFGWDFAVLSKEYNTYNIITGPSGPVAGAMQHDPKLMGDAPGGWDVYFAVANVQEALDAAAVAGGTVTVQPMPIEELGIMGFADDPAGATFGMWQHMVLHGFAASGEPGYPAWFELHTRTFDESVKFYESVLPVQASESEMPGGMNYATLDVDGEQGAGIWDISGVLPEDVPTGWTIWFSVNNVDEAVATARKLSGSVEMEPEDTEQGRVATLSDPAGASFNIINHMPN